MHDVCQPLPTDNLHKTNIKDNAYLMCKSARVKEIGLQTSKGSDVATTLYPAKRGARD